MGEERRKSRARAEILSAEPRCIYCSGPAETIEHMPPRVMLRGRQRPSGLEFGACKNCNNGTRGADVTAAIFARINPNNTDHAWQSEEMRKLLPALDTYAPGVREEISRSSKWQWEWLRGPSGLLRKFVKIEADGPRLHAYLTTFGAKLGMALYREHVGCALPIDGAVWCQFALNAGITQKSLDDRIKIMPMQETLRQGKRNVADQFVYRFNTDEKTVVAAVAGFHSSLWFTIFASSSEQIIELISRPELTGLPTSKLLRPGELIRNME